MSGLPELNNQYYAMRHGRSKPNVDKIIVSHRRHDARFEYGLVPEGIDQAEHSSRASGFESDIAIVSSPLPRAIQTARVLQEISGAADFVIDDRLRERGFGDMELQSADLYHEVWSRDARSATHTYRGVESLCAVAERGLDAMADLEKEMAGRVIVLVGHADPINILKAALWRQPLRSHRKAFSIDNAEIQPLSQPLQF